MPDASTPDSPDVTIRRATISDVAELSEFIKPFVAQGRLLRRTTMELEILVFDRESRLLGQAPFHFVHDVPPR